MTWTIRYLIGVVGGLSITVLALYVAGQLLEWNTSNLSVELFLNPVVLLALLLIGFVKYGFSSY